MMKSHSAALFKCRCLILPILMFTILIQTLYCQLQILQLIVDVVLVMARVHKPYFKSQSQSQPTNQVPNTSFIRLN